jgi:beta-phosphoglucomutase
MNKVGVIFDLDGVIVDTAKYHFIAWKHIANKLGFDFTEAHNEQLKGVSRVRSLDLILDLSGQTIEAEEKERLLKEKNEHYLSLISDMGQSEILPGILELLKYLKEQNIPFSLGSASKNARLILKTLNLLDLFDAIVDGNDVTNAKPDPEVFLRAAEKLNLKAEQCIVVEDAVAGVDAANNAGMISIGIGEEANLHKADHVLPSTKELSVQFFESLIQN